MGLTDETRYLNMIKNRPSVSLIPAASKKILASTSGTNLFGATIFAAILFGSWWNQTRELWSYKLYPTRKRFTFKSDPYSGTVNCTYQDVPYKQCGF